ncbi:glycosyltransferase family 2 protein [Francisella philomiragia]|uniref:glycosyltransferase family 2 protein n=1 Tax=Francisella philomiragia TaxID=28110 RepID=UPI0019039138|nr:glycosyltransferase family 2 protein [Francisella philomiragia]MBK2025264.1 glycosyltransferase family 2 protein [Francisella philomiragia]
MTISVCIATYNGEKYIKKQLDSILVQLGSNDEVIISDDGSTDNTLQIVKSINNPMVKIFNGPRKGYVKNFEFALSKASGEYIFLCDQDDIWKKNKIQTTLPYFNDYDLIVSDANIIDSNSHVINNSFYKVNGSRKGLLKNIVKNSYLGCTMAFNRKVLNMSIPFPKDIPTHDWWIGMLAEINGKTIFINDKLVSYRRHDNNTSHAGGKSTYSLIRKIIFRIAMIKNLIKNLN